MKYSELLIKIQKETREYDSVNATFLMKGGFVDQTMAGVYTFLPLGLRVLTKIENVVREEMNTLGAEMLMPALSPSSLWETTGRRETVDVLFEARGGNDASRQKNGSTYVLNSTHEEVITPIVQQLKPSYKDLPFAVYQIQTKFRNEERAKSGLLRGREFRMKDLYSFHAAEEDFNNFYEKAKEVYVRIFDRLGIGSDTHIVMAGGGDFTKDFTHEFQTICETGEDEIYFDESEGAYYNKEVAPEELKANATPVKASEVGNIFPLGTKFSSAFAYTVQNAKGEAVPVYMGSYGIGTSRIMGVLVEKFHDDAGIIWPDAVAPFQVHLVSIAGGDATAEKRAEEVYTLLESAGIEVLFDNRPDASPGEKLGDADLIGIPWRVIVSKKTGAQIEVKRRDSSDARLMDVDEFIQSI